jgi:transaldolase
MNQLDGIKQFTTVVADSGDIESIRHYQPEDATTNPSLLLKAAGLALTVLIDDAIAYGKQVADAEAAGRRSQRQAGGQFWCGILKSIPGRVSTEVDARLSFDKEKSIEKARHLVELYQEQGIDKSRILIKLASTWEGIRAAEVLEKEGIHCNLTLLFSFAQARACAEAGVFLVSPFVGRIYDWYQGATADGPYVVDEDPGVKSVRNIYDYFKQHRYEHHRDGRQLPPYRADPRAGGCDRLTISLTCSKSCRKKRPGGPQAGAPPPVLPKPKAMTEAEFRWEHNRTNGRRKLADGIRMFAVDQRKLEDLLAAKL